MLKLYQFLTEKSEPLLNKLLERRMRKGKEDAVRVSERRGIASRPRPGGHLVWVHAASVGEAQSALIVINNILASHKKLHILVTTGTKTSAELMEKNLPERSFHQYYPIDHPLWVEQFLSHWQPDLVLWMESELWPNMLCAIKNRNIPAALINARLSDKSYAGWVLLKGTARKILQTFTMILCQSERGVKRFKALGANDVIYTDNIKYSAAPLPADKTALKDINAHFRGRPVWLFASTHAGEEELACRVHEYLKNSLPNILTVIVPRHPERGKQIYKTCKNFVLNTVLRGEDKAMPQPDTDIYIANTLGELGLFYRAVPVACIGRSFSNDGGGGHNPIEAAQLNCAVLHGPNVQHLQDIYDQMADTFTATQCQNKQELTERLRALLSDQDELRTHQSRAIAFARDKDKVLERVMGSLKPLLEGLMI